MGDMGRGFRYYLRRLKDIDLVKELVRLDRSVDRGEISREDFMRRAEALIMRGRTRERRE